MPDADAEKEWGPDYFLDEVGVIHSGIGLMYEAMAQLCINCGGEVSIPMIANAHYEHGKYRLRSRIINGAYEFKLFALQEIEPEVSPDDVLKGST